MRELQRLLRANFRPSGPTEQQRLDKNALARARRLAAKHGITIEREHRDGDYWVFVKGLERENDPCDGNRFCVGGCEVLVCVETYVAHLTKPAEAA